MKPFIFHICFLYFLMFHLVFAQEIPVTGTWEVNDYTYDIAVTCECTVKQKKAITREIKSAVKNEFDLISLDTYFEFDLDNKVKGTLVTDEFETTYKQENDVVTIFFEEDNAVLKLVPQRDERIMILELKREKLQGFSRSFEMEEVGQVEFKYTHIKFIFKNLFDEPYETYLDEQDL